MANILKYSYRSYGLTIDEAVNLDECPPATTLYLLNYGLRKSAQDCVAGVAKDVTEVLKSKKIKDTAVVRNAIAVVVDFEIATRFEKIRAGTVGDRATGPRDELRATATSMVESKVKASGKKVTAERIAELVEEALADPTRRAVIQTEHDRRLAEDSLEITI